MVWIWRSLCTVGALLVVGAVALAVWQHGMEYASWVAAVIGALSLAGGLLTRTRTPAPDDSSSPGNGAGDAIDQTRIRTKRNVIGKQGRGTEGGGDRIRQRDIHSDDGDVIGKQDRE
ncbi:hypothetical protein HNR25_003943 [Streptomonospora salina]|uniref:Uncharacterized protein n=2 Tax=Streptomonospora salina TaxID=104205 RepID=A0A841EB07_9ACTN|nr:hypothetical protein [Streptomonospora salina]MBB6000192.1 hypothetical protein [Streptomonospora salina]